MIQTPKNKTDQIDLEQEKANLRQVMQASQSAIWAIEKNELLKPRKLPDDVEEIFRTVLRAWQDVFQCEKFGILCVRSGKPEVGPLHDIQLGEKFFLEHRTGTFMTIEKDGKTKETPMPLSDYTGHIVILHECLSPVKSIWYPPGSLDNYTRGKDAFLFTK